MAGHDTRNRSSCEGDHSVLGASPIVHELRELIRKTATSDSSVLILGETGVGKERVARALHQGSARAGGPFVPVNCSAVTDTLLESELFGHVRGAFTDARRERAGLFRAAGGGTLFLDELGEMPLAVQAKLLRALETRRVRPVGADHEVSFDARVLSATNRPVERLLEEGRLREDLFYRVAVICIEVPPLRDRGEDVVLMARHFLAEFAQRAGVAALELSPEAEEWIRGHSWPGNVRELKNCVERAVALSSGRTIRLAEVCLPGRTAERGVPQLPTAAFGGQPSSVPSGSPSPWRRNNSVRTIWELEAAALRDALARAGGNRSAAARLLGISRRTIQRRLRRDAV